MTTRRPPPGSRTRDSGQLLLAVWRSAVPAGRMRRLRDAAGAERALLHGMPSSEDAGSFDGTWSVYPYFASGTILLSSRSEGVFLVKPRTESLVP